MNFHVDLYGYGWNYPWCHQTWQGSENPGVFLGFDRTPSVNVGFPAVMLEGSGGHVNVGFSSMPFQ